MRVRITRPARGDIRQLFDHLKTEAGRRKAQEIVTEIRERCHGLSRMPERYQHLEGFEQIGLRRRVYRDYLLVYRILGAEVEVLRIIHGASDYSKLFEAKP